MILTLVVIGGKAIKHFSDYGCLGRMSISAQGVDFTPVPANSCPEIPKGVEQQQMSLSSGVENDKMCWKMLFANGGNSDYYPNCIMSDPTLQLGVILACTVGFYAFRQSRIAAYQSGAFSEAKWRFFYKIDNTAGGANALPDNFFKLAEQLRETDVDDVVERAAPYQDGVRAGNARFSEMREHVFENSEHLDVNANAIAETLDRLEGLAENSQALEMISTLKNRLAMDRDGTVPDPSAESDSTQNLLDTMEDSFLTCVDPLSESLTAGRLTCEQASEDMASEGMMEETIQSSSIASNDPIVKSMSEALPGDNIEGRAAEMDTEDIARAIGVGGEVSGVDMMSSMAAMVFPFVNFMFMMNIFENVLHSAVTSVMHALNAGLKETMQALEKLSKQEALQFNSTINIIESK
eukprot:Nk52_evm1s94 gene=Nk52_evmTU1s94